MIGSAFYVKYARLWLGDTELLKVDGYPDEGFCDKGKAQLWLENYYETNKNDQYVIGKKYVIIEIYHYEKNA